MKSFRNGILCLGLFVCGAAVAQEQPADQQQPPTQQQPPATPATPAAPGAQEPVAPTPTPRTGIQLPPPPPPKLPDVRQPGETGWWIGLEGWVPTQNPRQMKGHAAAFTESGSITLEGKPKFAEGVEVGMAVGLHNALRFTAFQARASGNYGVVPVDTHLWDQTYTANTGDFVTTNYKLQNAKVSFEYLTWPFPVESRRFRLKTLWQVQYTSIQTTFNAPLKPVVDNNGNPILDSAGNLISYVGTGTRYFIYPSFGLGVAYYSGRHIRFESNASAFAFPKRSTVWDADGSVNVKYGHIGIGVGAKAFHFKTSPKAETFMFGTLGSAFVSLRWYSQ